MNITATCKLMPAMTSGQLSYFGSLDKFEMITNITKPIDDVWEFTVLMKDHIHAVVFLTEDARCVGTCYQEIIPFVKGQSRSNRRMMKYVACYVHDYDDWLGFPKKQEYVEDEYGFHRLDKSHGLLPDLRKWVVSTVANRIFNRACDVYGRSWPEGTPVCNICGQPHVGKCSHEKLTEDVVRAMRAMETK